MVFFLLRSPYTPTNVCAVARRIIPSRNNEEGYLSSYERFVLSPPKSFFKALFIGNTKLASCLKTMSDRAGVIKGLRDQECERGNRTKRPPIAYVPVIDEVQEKLNLDNSEGRTQKIKLANDTEFRAGVWFSGTPEQFLNHVKQALNAITRKGLFSEYDTAYARREEARRHFDDATADVRAALNSRAARDVIDSLKERRTAFLQETRDREADRIRAAEGFFSLYANLLSVEQRIAWEKIVDQQIDTAPWTDLKGRKRTTPRAKTKKSFMQCTTHHLLTIFNMDAAEQQLYYISNVLKKPQRVTVRAFFTRVEQLNSYVKLLPSIYNSPKATESTEPAKPFGSAAGGTTLAYVPGVMAESV